MPGRRPAQKPKKKASKARKTSKATATKHPPAKTPARKAGGPGPAQPSVPPHPLRLPDGNPSLPPSPRVVRLVGAARPGPKPVLRPGGPLEPHWDAIELTDAKAQLKRYYQSAQMSSPMGGFLEPLLVRSEDDGSGTVILECSASSLRFSLSIPAATAREKREIKQRQDAGEDPTCPRHDPPQRLNRVGPHLVCPLCGVRYGRV